MCSIFNAPELSVTSLRQPIKPDLIEVKNDLLETKVNARVGQYNREHLVISCNRRVRNKLSCSIKTESRNHKIQKVGENEETIRETCVVLRSLHKNLSSLLYILIETENHLKNLNHKTLLFLLSFSVKWNKTSKRPVRRVNSRDYWFCRNRAHKTFIMISIAGC